MFSSLTLVSVISCSFAPELDFRPLPLANTTNGYKFTVTIDRVGKKPVVLPFAVGRGTSPAEVAELLNDSLEGHPWVVNRNDLRFTFIAFEKTSITRIRIHTDGPGPLVNLVPRAPAKK